MSIKIIRTTELNGGNTYTFLEEKDSKNKVFSLIHTEIKLFFTFNEDVNDHLTQLFKRKLLSDFVLFYMEKAKVLSLPFSVDQFQILSILQEFVKSGYEQFENPWIKDLNLIEFEPYNYIEIGVELKHLTNQPK